MLKAASFILIMFFHLYASGQTLSISQRKNYFVELNSNNYSFPGGNGAIIEMQIFAPDGCIFTNGGWIGSRGKWDSLIFTPSHDFWARAVIEGDGKSVTTTDYGKHWVMDGYSGWTANYFYTNGEGSPPIRYRGPLSCTSDYLTGSRKITARIKYYANAFNLYNAKIVLDEFPREVEVDPPRTFSCTIPEIINMGESVSGRRNEKKLNFNCDFFGKLSINGKPLVNGDIFFDDALEGLHLEIDLLKDLIAVTSDQDFSGEYRFQLAVKWELP